MGLSPSFGMTTRAKNKTPTQIVQVDGGKCTTRRDYLATEEPLELRLMAGKEKQTLAVTMRTPGNDFELAAGFLLAEGIIEQREAIKKISYCIDKDLSEEQRYNIVNISLNASELPDLASLERHFTVNSSCGMCGKASLEALENRQIKNIESSLHVSTELICTLPEKLRKSQGLFDITGGLHAVALFDADGNLFALREDVGRHNAMDKLLGWALLENLLPLSNHIILVSGRASFELTQKALVAGVSVFCAVSAPSSLAVDLARKFGMTLVGFLREEKFNIYTHQERVSLDSNTTLR
ncbi:MAG: formate dehydrogenase accessory sulfurtransferase FdhD [Trueperaceae bacterium]